MTLHQVSTKLSPKPAHQPMLGDGLKKILMNNFHYFCGSSPCRRVAVDQFSRSEVENRI